jgi:bacillithiol biosynthesis cysteine-adding enzyme BshC
MNSRFEFQLLNLDDFLPPLVKDYLRQPDKLKDFFHYLPSPESALNAMEWKKKNFPYRSLLAGRLKQQYAEVKSHPEMAIRQIEKLKSENTFTVTAGHQLNIFTGPLFFIYKLVSAIRLSELLNKKFPECEFIPVYWMVSEDHDLAEINHFYFKGKRIEWNQHQPGIPCGRLTTEGLAGIADTLLAENTNNEPVKNLLLLFRECYALHKTLASATREIIHRLFGKKGLIVIDADDPHLKSVLKPVIRDEMVNQSAYRLVSVTAEKIKLNYKAQVLPREINFFYLGNGIRERILKTQNGFSTHQTGKHFSMQEMNEEIENRPWNFSPNVITRPLYQEMILPGIACTGGPAEISYWLEYKSFFEHHGQRLPVLILRDSFLWIDKPVSLLIEKTGLKAPDFLTDENNIIQKLIEQAGYKDLKLDREIKAVEELYEKLSAKISAVDASLAGSVMAEKQKALKGIEHLEMKLRKALKQKEEVNLNRIRKIQQVLMPEGILQERRTNILDTVSGDFFNLLYQYANPLQAGLKIIEEKINT